MYCLKSGEPAFHQTAPRASGWHRFHIDGWITFARASIAVVGTGAFDAGSTFMSEPIPWLIEHSTQIAWHYLESTGEITEPAGASKFLLKTIDEMVLRGERWKLMLANRAIDAYRNRSKLLQAS